MSKGFIPKYSYFTNNRNVVVAVTTYYKKKVRGTAKCNPEDTFDLEKGKRLAKARCDAKIANLKIKTALSDKTFYQRVSNEFAEKAKKAHERYLEQKDARAAAEKEIKELLANM